MSDEATSSPRALANRASRESSARVSDSGDDVGRRERSFEPGSVPRSRRLPERQPVRALVVVLAYLLVVVAVTVALEALYGVFGLICAGLFAAAMTVPVAVLAPRPRAAEQDDPDQRPVLLRNVSQTRPSP